jgi:hypothetical protein
MALRTLGRDGAAATTTGADICALDDAMRAIDVRASIKKSLNYLIRVMRAADTAYDRA